MDKRKLLSELRTSVENLQYGENRQNELVKKCQLYIRKIFGNNSNYLEDLESVYFLPRYYYSGMPHKSYLDSFDNGKRMFLNLIDVMIEDIQLEEPDSTEGNSESVDMNNKQVFIVHGHDEAMRQTIARFIEKLKLIPIILGEKPSGGVKSILEKIEEYSDVSYAIVLLSPCDEGRKKGSTDLKPRARQNVIAELGYFIGKLGRRNVSILKNGDVEFPSDFLGNCYIEYDKSNWEQELFNELKTAGFNIDANDIM